MQYSYVIENEEWFQFEFEGKQVEITFKKERYRIHILCNHAAFIQLFKSPWIVVHSLENFVSVIASVDENKFFFAEMEKSLETFLEKLLNRIPANIVKAEVGSGSMNYRI